MDWQDEGLLLAVRPHGESSAIIEVLTAEHGRHAGLVRGARSKAMAPVLQPGTRLALAWRARLSEHLGNYRVEPVRSPSAAIMADRTALAALNAVSALLTAFLPEREPNRAVYDETVALVEALAARDARWTARYARWEVGLLATLGFPLDLSACAITGSRTDLAHVSPRTGRAVSRGAGAEWADRLLPLPRFLVDESDPDAADVHDALNLTGHFLRHWVVPAFERERLPEARARLLAELSRAAAPLASRPSIG